MKDEVSTANSTSSLLNVKTEMEEAPITKSKSSTTASSDTSIIPHDLIHVAVNIAKAVIKAGGTNDQSETAIASLLIREITPSECRDSDAVRNAAVGVAFSVLSAGGSDCVATAAAEAVLESFHETAAAGGGGAKVEARDPVLEDGRDEGKQSSERNIAEISERQEQSRLSPPSRLLRSDIESSYSNESDNDLRKDDNNDSIAETTSVDDDAQDREDPVARSTPKYHLKSYSSTSTTDSRDGVDDGGGAYMSPCQNIGDIILQKGQYTFGVFKRFGARIGDVFQRISDNVKGISRDQLEQSIMVRGRQIERAIDDVLVVPLILNESYPFPETTHKKEETKKETSSCGIVMCATA